MLKAWGRAICVLSLGLFVLHCGSSSVSTPPPRGDVRKILRVAYPREIDVLNAYTSQNLVHIAFSMVEGLITTNDRNEYIPVLAKTIPTEANGLVVREEDGHIRMTWPLHEGVLWHDGEPFTSADVCFTWRFVSSENSQTYNREEYLGIQSCETPDEHTVVFTWDGVYAYYAGIFEAILPEHILGGMTTAEIVNYEPYNRGSQTIGTGPFKFVEWKAGEYIRVVKNENYWRGDPYPGIDEIVWSFIPDSNTRLNAIKAGQYDFSQIDPVQVKELSDLPDYDVHLVESTAVMHFDVNVTGERGKRLFGDPDVRRALFHAIDREAIAKQLMEGTVHVAHTPLTPSNPYHNPDVPRIAFDPRLSERLLDAAGWLKGADGYRVKNGQRFEFVMLNRAGRVDHIAVATVIQAQLKAIGVDIRFETLESAAWTQRWRTRQWEGIVSTWYLPADPSLTNLYSCGGPNNMTGLCNPALDEVMRLSDRFLSFEERKPYLDVVQEMLVDAAVSLPIYYNVIPEVVHRRVRNYRGSGTNFGSFWNLYEWELVADLGS